MGNFTCSFLFLVFLLICDSYGLARSDLASSDEGECDQIMDVAILGDISQSMKEADRHQLVEIVNALVDKLGVSAAANHFGLVTFGDRATVHHNFSNTNYHNAKNVKSSVADALKVVPKREGTRTDLAENLALTELFTREGGDRPNARNVMLIFTDGIPYIARWDKEPQIPFAKLTEALEAKNVTIKVIGIGPGAAKKMDKIRETAGKKGKVVLYSNFEESSNKFYEDFKEFVCAPVDGKYTDWSPASECSATCGVGIQTLKRTCTNPPPSNGGRNCTRWGPAVKTISCNVQKCPDECDQIMDIAILGDISQSMKEADRHQLVDIVNALVDKLGVSAAANHFGLVTFGDRATVHLNFSNTNYHNAKNVKSSVADALKVVPKREGTRTDLAENLALTELFTREGGDRPNARNVMLIFTDGIPYIARWDKEPQIPFAKLTEALEAKNVTIKVIGIGPGAAKKMDKIRETAGKKGKVVLYTNFEESSNKFYEDFKEFVCAPVDGKYTDWSSASECSATCGVGIQTLRRTCTNPPPSNGGKNCTRWGPAEKKVSCNEGRCLTPIDGKYTDWSPASECSATCGAGIQTLKRTCTNPPPSNGGRNCTRLGPAVKTISCNEQKCPDDCHQIMDIAILGDISQSMKEADRHHLVDIVNGLVDKLGVSVAANHIGLVTFGDRATVHHNFSNTNYHNAKNVKSSVADALKVVPKREGTRTDLAENLALTELFTREGGDRPNAKNVMLIFTDGIPYIARWDKEPQIPFAKLTADLEAKDVTIKVIGIGPGAAKSEDKMKQTAGEKGKVVLYSNFTVLSKKLYEDFKEFVCAPVDGKYTDWSPASVCSVTCGVGIQTLRRTCTNPPPSNGGRNCTRWGPAVKTISCNEGRCPTPIDGKYTNWSPASKCSATCGVGIQTVKRTCTNPPPSNGGRNCTRWGPAVKTTSCNVQKCPIPPSAACPMDVAFIVDSSGSLESEFNDAKEVVKKLVMTLDKAPGKNRAAMVLFGSSASQVAQFGQYETVDKFQDAVQQLPKMGGRTRIDKALKIAVDQVLPAARQGVYKIDIILTDGVQSSGARGLKQTSKPLRDAGVRVLAVGIGTGMDKRRLRLMTDRDEDVVDAKNIQGRLQGILDDLSQHDCTPPEPGFLPALKPCDDDPVYARMCQKRATKDFCWFHPDFSATHCPKSCKLCV
ncbi:uncharacterized protein LOC144644910 [Oculina patagonica]